MKTIPEEPTINIIHINNRVVLIINPKPSLTMGPPRDLHLQFQPCWYLLPHDPGCERLFPQWHKMLGVCKCYCVVRLSLATFQLVCC